jgi:hypothetical protein
MKQLKWILILILCIASIFLINRAKAAVTLIYFEAVPGDQQINIRWGTATELNTAGFFVQRSVDQNNYIRLHSDIIPAQGSGVTGWEYEYTDSNLPNGQTFWYKLEEIETNGKSLPPYGPISAIPCNPCLPTPTKTSTVTKTPTLTKTDSSSPTRTPTPTRTTSSGGSSTRRTPTATSVSSYPGPSSSGAQTTITTSSSGLSNPAPTSDQESIVPSLTEEDISSEQSNATATLVPLPSITMIFPETPTPVQAAAVSDQNNPANEAPRSGWKSPQRLAVIGIVLAVWVILGGWFFFSFRRLD